MFRLDPLRRILASASATLIVISGCAGLTQTSMMLPQVDDPVQLSPHLQPLRDPTATQDSGETNTRIYGYGPRTTNEPEQIVPRREPGLNTPQGDGPTREAPVIDPPATDSPADKSTTGPRLGPIELAESEPMVLAVDVGERAQIGNGSTFKLIVRNPNPHVLNNVVIEADFDNALIFPGHDEKRIRRSLGSLSAGKSEEMAVMLSSETAGKHCVRFTLTADNVAATRREVCVEYIANELEISILGPDKRVVGTRGEFTIKLQNRAAQELTDISLSVTHDPALEPREGSAGAKFEKQKMSWELDSLQPGEFLQVQIEFECVSAVENTCVIVDVTSSELPAERKAECLQISERKHPLAVELSDTRDPVNVEETTEHLIILQNRSNETVDAIRIVARIPVQLDTVRATAELDGQQIDVTADIDIDRVVFRDIGELAAGSTLRIRLESKTLTTGDGQVLIRVMYGNGDDVIVMSEPLTVNTRPTSE